MPDAALDINNKERHARLHTKSDSPTQSGGSSKSTHPPDADRWARDDNQGRLEGLELVFSSNHAYPGAQGGQDVYVSTRASGDDPWSAPVNLGTAVNTPAGETRPSLSRDAQTLLFGRAPGTEGMSDIYVATRDRLTGVEG